MSANFFSRILIVFLVPFFASVTLADDFYVAKNVDGASNDNDGRSPVFISGNHGPWKSIQHAVYNVSAGDTVYVGDGDYRDEDTGWGRVGAIRLTKSGTENSPIRFAAYNCQNPIVETFQIFDQSWIEVEGFTFKSNFVELPMGWVDMPAIKTDTDDVLNFKTTYEEREVAVREKFATYTNFYDFLTTDYFTGLDIRNVENVSIQDNRISHYCFGIQVQGESSQVKIDRNHISYCLDGIFTWQPGPSMTDSIVSNNKIRQSFNNGMQIREGADKVLVIGNDVKYSGTSHISLLAGCKNCTVRNNIGMYGGYYSETMRFPGSSAINVNGCNEGNIVEGNIAAYQIDLTGRDGNGYISDVMLEGAGVVFRDNFAWRNMGSGIRAFEAPNNTIVFNTLSENGFFAVNPFAGVGVYLGNEQDTGNTIENNLFHRNSVGGIKSFGTITQQTSIDKNVYSKTGLLIWDGVEVNERAYSKLKKVQRKLCLEYQGRVLNYSNFQSLLFAPASKRCRPQRFKLQAFGAQLFSAAAQLFDDYVRPNLKPKKSSSKKKPKRRSRRSRRRSR